MSTYFSIKRLILGILFFAIGLMTLLTLCCPLWKLIDLPENGFSLLDFKAEYHNWNYMLDDGVIIVGGIFAILQLILSVAGMTFAVLNIFFFSEKTVMKIFLGLAIPCLCLTFGYMLLGVIYWKTNDWKMNDITSLSYIGFIFVSLLFIAYLICNGLVKNKKYVTKKQESSPIASPAESATQTITQDVNNAQMIAEALKTYKELLDNGIITQEEFDEKKKQFLSK